MVRVEAELARYADEQRPDIGFLVYDSRLHTYRLVKREMIRSMVSGALFVDQTELPDPRSAPRHWLGRFFNGLDRSLLFIRRPRRAAILALENLRSHLPPSQRGLVERAQSVLFNDRYRRLFFDSDGSRRSLVEFRAVVEDDLPALAGATVLSAGAEWNTKDPDRLRQLKEREGFRLAVVCYDLIPILFPQYFLKRDGDVFYNYFQAAAGFVDKFICISNCTARDLAEFFAAHGKPIADIAVQHLGSELHEATATALPAVLKSRRYVLFVSTIEPRKNHEMIYRVWRRLIECGIPQKHDFQLVLVGQPGWDTDALIDRFRNGDEERLRYFPDLKDNALVCLYKNAAFCLYPSHYEGYGLPIVEAFGHGRAVIASNAGSIPEVVQNLSPCLDPHDEEAWFQTISRWIEFPSAVGSYEKAIEDNFVHAPWPGVAAKYFAAAQPDPAGSRPSATDGDRLYSVETGRQA